MMSLSLSKRRLIPRWRKTASTLGMAEAEPTFDKSSARAPLVEPAEVARKIELWSRTPSIGHLGDVLSCIAAPDSAYLIRDVAQQVVAGRTQATQVQVAIARSILGDDGSEEFLHVKDSIEVCNPYVRERVREARRILAVNAKNPLVLLDLAQLRLADGDERQAGKLVRAARSLSPDSRLIIRTYARYLTHVGRQDEAHSLISKHPRTKIDPWMMASEVALSQVVECAPRFAKAGLRIASEGDLPARHVSELAGALAGLELQSGNVKRARELFRLALKQPNDNVLAQVVTDRRILSLSIDMPKGASTPDEATALVAWAKTDAEAAFVNGINWHAQEPFSSRPLAFLTSLLCAEGRYEEAVMLCGRGLVASKKDRTLLVNLAYSYAMQKDIQRAERILNRVDCRDGVYKGQVLATRGLIRMLRGDYEDADLLYAEAIDTFARRRSGALSALCRAYYARAALDSSHPRVGSIIADAVDAHRKTPVPDSAFVLRRIGLDLEKQEESLKFRTYQWNFDAAKNELVRVSRIVPSDEPLIRMR